MAKRSKFIIALANSFIHLTDNEGVLTHDNKWEVCDLF